MSDGGPIKRSNAGFFKQVPISNKISVSMKGCSKIELVPRVFGITTVMTVDSDGTRKVLTSVSADSVISIKTAPDRENMRMIYATIHIAPPVNKAPRRPMTARRFRRVSDDSWGPRRRYCGGN